MLSLANNARAETHLGDQAMELLVPVMQNMKHLNKIRLGGESTP